jgi:hypothetical protein
VFPKLVGDDKDQAIAFHKSGLKPCGLKQPCGLKRSAAQKTPSRSTVVPVMMIPVSMAVSIVLGQNLRGFFAQFLPRVISPCQMNLYGEFWPSHLTQFRQAISLEALFPIGPISVGERTR